MPHTRDNWQTRFKNSSYHNFFVKGPEILNRTTSTTNNEQIQIIPLISTRNISSNFLRSPFTLNLGRIKKDVNTWESPADGRDNISNNGSTTAGYYPNSLRKLGQSLLEAFLKQAFFCQFFLKLFKLNRKRPNPIRLSFFNDDGVATTWFINLYTPNHIDLHSFFQVKP
ncbi:Uncharacterised protein [Streptococcus pneumoniae]|nr:Uncharacterised protein [Streptococcus pneumoniae]